MPFSHFIAACESEEEEGYEKYCMIMIDFGWIMVVRGELVLWFDPREQKQRRLHEQFSFTDKI